MGSGPHPIAHGASFPQPTAPWHAGFRLSLSLLPNPGEARTWPSCPEQLHIPALDCSQLRFPTPSRVLPGQCLEGKPVKSPEAADRAAAASVHGALMLQGTV